MPLHEHADGCLLDVLLSPRASRQKIGPIHDEQLKVSITAAPVDGQANRMLIDSIAKQVGLPKSKILLVRGQTSKRKRLLLRGLSPDQAKELIGC